MIDTQLILVDGISGSGKSTTAQLLYLNLRRQGLDVDWFYEHEVPHPIYRADEVAKAQQEGCSERNHIHDKALENWRRFVDTLRRKNSIVILESTLLQTGMGSMYLMGMEREDILRRITRTEEIIRVLHPVLIYFRQEDVERALTITNERRGGGFDGYLIEKIGGSFLGRQRNVHDFPGVVKVFHEYRTLADEIVSRLSIEKQIIDNSNGNWEEVLGQISRYLHLEPPLSHIQYEGDLNDFAGRYQNQDSSQEWGLAVANHVLYFDDAYQTKLVPKKNNVFYLEGNCIELFFSRDDRGHVTEVECRGNILDEPVIGTRWRKVPAD